MFDNSMTLILTCLTEDNIIQVADRRLTMPDGTLYDDDTNKAVFYCGQVAVAYTGIAYIEGKPTAEWIGSCMTGSIGVEAAMTRVAECAERYFRKNNLYDRRFAVVATGWATYQGKQPLRPFICVASNFLSDSWGWKSSADDRVSVRTIFFNKRMFPFIFAAGQGLSREELRFMRRKIKHDADKRPPVKVLGDTIQTIASGTDDRARRVGKGMIIHLLSRKAVVEGRTLIVTPLETDCHSFLYVSKEGRTDRFQGAIIACNGTLLTGFGGGSIPPGEKGTIRTQMEGPHENSQF